MSDQTKTGWREIELLTEYAPGKFPRRAKVRVSFWCPLIKARPLFLTSDYENRGNLRVVLGGVPVTGRDGLRPFDQLLNAVDGAAIVDKMDPVLMGHAVFFDVINVGEEEIFSGLFLTWRKEP